MDKRKISPFYRTSSPVGAAALPPPMKTKVKVEQGKGTADHLMPLGYLFCLFVHQSPPPGHPARPEAQPARPEAQPARLKAQPAKPEA